MDRIYLDHAATTPVRPEVQEAMTPLFAAYNAGSQHREGREAREHLDRARAQVAGLLGARPREIIFTASGSEAANLALAGVARTQPLGRIVISAIEHHAVRHTAEVLREFGHPLGIVPVDATGVAGRDAFEREIAQGAVLASVMLANNEIGTLQPIAELARSSRERGVLFHTDAVQAAPWCDLNVDALGIDLLSLAAHKFYGPKGVGALYVRSGTPLHALIFGGSQEFGMRAGTENVAGVAGLAHALELACAERDAVGPRVRSLRERFEKDVAARVPGVRVNGAGAPRLPNISSISFEEVAGTELATRLDLEGVAVSTGSACASGVSEPSDVVRALGLPERLARGVVRFSLGRTTTAQEMDRVARILARVVPQMRSFSVPA